MNILEVIASARLHLQQHERISLRLLRRQFELDDDMLDEVIEELVDVLRVARREGSVLVWMAGGAPVAPMPLPAPLPVTRAPRAYTPKHLADKILQSRSALEGERK